MTDAFISYSRKNTTFVKKFNKSLLDEGLDIWVDFDDILPTTDWLQEIYRAIESTDNFMFVISPESLASEYCILELNYAVEHGKRIFPIYYKEADTRDHPSLSKHQYIFFDGSVPYKDAVKQTTETLETNLGWVRFHTDLLKRALQWEKHGYEKSYNLHGEELKDSLDWLEQVKEDWDPQPTALQKNFVTGSRQAQKLQRRNTVISVAATLVFAGLAIFGFVESRLATDRARLSTAYLVSSEANQASEPDLALLLSLHAVDIQDDNTTLSTMFSTMSRFSDLERILHGIDNNVRDVVFSHDNSRLITAENGDHISLWDLATGNRVFQFEVDDPDTNPVTSLAMHPYTNILAASQENGILNIYDLESLSLIDEFKIDETFRQIRFSPSGEQIGIAAEGHAIVYDLKTQQIVFQHDIEDHINVLSVTFNNNGNIMAAGDAEGTVHMWSLDEENRYSSFITNQGEIFALEFGSEPHTLFTAGRDITIRAWNVPSGELITEAPFRYGHTAPILTMDYDPIHDFLVTAGEDLKILVWNFVGNEFRLVKSMEGHTNYINAARFNNEGSEIATASQTKVLLWEAENTPPGTLIGHSGAVSQLALAPEEDLLISAGDQGEVIAWKPWTGFIYNQIVLNDRPFITSLATDPNGDRVVLGADNEVVYIWNANSNTIEKTFNFGEHISAVALSPDYQKVLVGGDFSHLSVWDINTNQSRSLDWGGMDEGDLVTDIKYHPNGAWAAASYMNGSVVIWDVESGDIIEVLHLPKDEETEEGTFGDNEKALSLAFDQDGNVLFVGSSHGIIHLYIYNEDEGGWVYDGGEEVHSSWVNSLDYTPELNRLVSASEDSTMVIWQISNEEGTLVITNLSVIRGSASGVPTAVFFDGGDKVASGTLEGNVVLWEVDPDVIIERICKVVNRSLELDEWLRVIEEPTHFSNVCFSDQE